MPISNRKHVFNRIKKHYDELAESKENTIQGQSNNSFPTRPARPDIPDYVTRAPKK